jgi:hypothetical protein
VLRVGTISGSYLVDGRAEPEARSGHRVTALAPGGWAVADGHTVFHGGREIATFQGAVADCLLPAGTGALVGTSGAHVVRIGADGARTAVESFDAIPSRDEWYTPWGAPPDTRSMAGDGNGVLLVNVHVGGVWRSEGDAAEGRRAKGEDAWRPVVDVEMDTHQVMLDGELGLAAAAVGFGSSSDGGRT